MPILVAIAIYAVIIARRPIDKRLKKRHVGPLAMASAGVALFLAWDWLHPAGVSTTYFLGEFAGVTAVYLMTWTLVLATRFKWLEQWFGGLDRMYFWHKRWAMWSLVLIVAHIIVTGHGGSGASLQQSAHLAQLGQLLGVISAVGLLGLVVVSLARVGNFLHLPYQRWLFLHRLTGLLLLIALVHGWALDAIIGGSAPLRAIFVMMGGIGMTAYAYDELVLRRRAPRAVYAVRSVERPAADVIDVTLAPVGPALPPLTAGQFVYLRAGGSHAWREHPFSIAGTYPDGSVRLTIRALGRGTGKLYNDLREGLPATLCGPYGMFDHTLGGPRQIWIAGGIGIAPFLGWLTSSTSAPPPRTDLFYSAPDAGEAPFVPELAAAAEREPGLRFHPHYSRRRGRLTGAKIEDAVGTLSPDTHVFLCGPARMVANLSRDLHRRGIPRHHIHSEHFAFR
jgi:predicted ferric reductase